MKKGRIVISGSLRGAGKTTISIGLERLLTRRGIRVCSFKKGPDYIDPMWHRLATYNPSYNLDFFMMGERVIKASFINRSRDADFSIIEGNMGLYDGLREDGKDSTSYLARLLSTPVILIIDTSRMTRGIAPLILGYQQFEPPSLIAGIILNKVSNERHKDKLLSAIRRYCKVEVLGAISRSDEIKILERHLGLIPSVEDKNSSSKIELIADILEDCLEIDRIMEIGRDVEELEDTSLPPLKETPLKPLVKIGVAYDQSFSFYYPENLEALRTAGAELVFFNTLKDSLPKCDGILFGGGFPEVFMDELKENRILKDELRQAIEDGMPVYAECGGLIYLSRTIEWKGITREMAGILPIDMRMHHNPKAHGYVILEKKKGRLGHFEERIKGHEFHYSDPIKIDRDEFIYSVKRGRGIDGKSDGILYKNTFASYTHLHSLGNPNWAKRFIEFCKMNR